MNKIRTAEGEKEENQKELGEVEERRMGLHPRYKSAVYIHLIEILYKVA